MNDNERTKVDTYSDLYPGRFLHADNFKGRNVTLTIADVWREGMEGEQRGVVEPKAILSFVGSERQMVLPKINGVCLVAMFGKSVKDWIGKRVTFYPTAKLMPYPRSRGDNRPPDECIRVFGSPELTSPLTVEFRPPRRKAIRMVLQPVETRRKAAEPAPMTDEEAAEIEAQELAAIAAHDEDD